MNNIMNRTLIQRVRAILNELQSATHQAAVGFAMEDIHARIEHLSVFCDEERRSAPTIALVPEYDRGSTIA